MFQELGNKYAIAHCLEGVGAGIALVDQFKRAVRLFGAAYSLRESIGALPGPVTARQLEAMMEPARNAMSDAAFASAWAAGRTMTLEQEVTYALAESAPD